MLIAILIIIIIICLIVILEAYKNNKFEELIIRINEVEANLDAILNKKFDLLNKSINIIKSETKVDKEVLSEIVKLRSRKLNNFELDKQLNEAYSEFKSYEKNFEILKQNEAFTKIEIDLIESESTIIALKKYYNDVSNKFNKLATSFPANIVAKLKKLKLKELFEEEIKEDTNTLEIIFEDDIEKSV